MAIRVVARIRPRQAGEMGQDVIVSTGTATASASATAASKGPMNEEGGCRRTSRGGPATLVRIPSPKNENEDFTFQFSGVYDEFASQQVVFDQEGLFWGVFLLREEFAILVLDLYRFLIFMMIM